MSTSPVTAKTISLLKLALQPKNIKLIQFNQKQEVINLLIQVPDEIDPAQIASMIWAMDQKLIVIIESKTKLDQQTIVMIMKRQLNLLNSSVFSSAEIKAKRSNEVDWIEDIHFTALNVIAKRKSNSGIDKNLLMKIAVACGGVFVQ